MGGFDLSDEEQAEEEDLSPNRFVSVTFSKSSTEAIGRGTRPLNQGCDSTRLERDWQGVFSSYLGY
jgi:hypothetical protein